MLQNLFYTWFGSTFSFKIGEFMESVKRSPPLWLLDINVANKSLPLSLSLFFVFVFFFVFVNCQKGPMCQQ